MKGPAVAERVTVRIDALAVGGDAVGRQQGGAHEGRATFVALTAPGEIVHARVLRAKARVAWAELEALVSAPSAARATPPCPWFGRCGGCQWQHVSLIEQRNAKRDIVARALGLRPADVPLRAPAPGGMGYRERVRLLVGHDGTLGFRARRSHAIVGVAACGLLSEPLARALSGLRAAGARLPGGAEVDLQAGREGVHLRLVWNAPARTDVLDALANSWLDRLRPAGVVGVATVSSDGETGRAGLDEVDVSESERIPLRIPAGGFSQVGRNANAALIDAAMEALGSNPGRILELYAGSGNFTRHLCARGLDVTASDGDLGAVERGRRNAPGAAWRLARPGAVPTLAGIPPDTVFVDPPRGGLDAPSLRVALSARRQIVYVSCDPQTLGRDAREIVRAGFALRSAVALDLLPHTFHVEVVARFARVGTDSTSGDALPAGG